MFTSAAERWYSEPDPSHKELLYRLALEAAAEVVGVELLCRLEGQVIPPGLRLTEDWRKLSAPLAADKFIISARRTLEEVKKVSETLFYSPERKDPWTS